eukprot:CAMPEP_0198257790 /NCGR_PEP_ID=MMETSP1447-20131203/7372_1 /TAXON_ID=420782 /ORGANISM="Chaetoceros dichaeta, Strain CCMP1751" /LENGTH=239 /DNA_ID=CAMNT_0043944773 /DNA_START=106 /DNA_END=825 /DNA_ORIENTATION=-
MASLQGGLATLQDSISGTCDGIDSKQIGDELEGKVLTLFEEANSLPISLSKDDGNIEVRTKFDDQYFTTLAEAKIVKSHPKDHKGFLENFLEAFAQADPMVKGINALEHDNQREGVKAFLNFPFPIKDRVMVYWKYLKLNRNQDEHMIILSEKGNQSLLDKYLSPDERENYVLGRIFLCAYWVKPVYGADKNIVGSNIRYMFSGDVGGAMPKWVQSSVGPKNALESLKGFIKYGDESTH